MRLVLALITAFAWLTSASDSVDQGPGTIRVATFNASLNRSKPGELVRDLSTSDQTQIRNVAEIIQRVRPDILLINEFDHDAEGKAASLFQANYLSKPWNGSEPISYPHHYSAEVNTGVPSGQDLDGDGQVASQIGSRGYGNDAIGFGLFPGQYGMVIYSKFPIDREGIRSLTKLLWKDVPNALLPTKKDGSSWYSPEALKALRLSSKGHWDVPIRIDGKTLHLLVSHPTPPAFDGPEDRNGKRNHDEIRLWADYISGGEKADYLRKFLGEKEFKAPESFVILGDLNADPIDGGSVPGAIQQLLEHPKVNASPIPKSDGGAEASALQKGANLQHKSNPEQDTADFDERVGNLRADYVLPSKDLNVKRSGIFWPKADDPAARLVKMTPVAASSDHRLVFVEIEWKP